jgi:hypothetical protein
MSERTKEEVQWVPVKCDCGFNGGQYLRHYDKVRCACGVYYWALRPRRDGALVAVAYTPPQDAVGFVTSSLTRRKEPAS